jgi:hypothetical protein
LWSSLPFFARIPNPFLLAVVVGHGERDELIEVDFVCVDGV